MIQINILKIYLKKIEYLFKHFAESSIHKYIFNSFFLVIINK